MKTQPGIVVVGSGLGGLATACTLAARGYAVTVVEKNEWLGGKAALLEDKGYRFDMGPTILTVISYSLAHGPRANIPLVAAVALGDSTRPAVWLRSSFETLNTL